MLLCGTASKLHAVPVVLRMAYKPPTVECIFLDVPADEALTSLWKRVQELERDLYASLSVLGWNDRVLRGETLSSTVEGLPQPAKQVVNVRGMRGGKHE